MRKLFAFSLSLFIAATATAQGVKVSATAGNPHASAMLEVESNTKGFLPPRMTTVERDAISNPADGLVVYNTTTSCLNFRVAGFWKEVCGSCTPAVTPANAGADQTGIVSTSATLAGNVPQTGTGSWSIVSGTGGSLANANLNNTSFTGTPGTTYVLRWTITGVCGTTTDDVTIAFANNWKYAFITRDNVNGTGVGSGNLGGLSGADNICQTRATAAGLNGTYKAWLSDDGTSAASRLTQYNGEYRLLNGTKLADNWSDLVDGSIDNPLNITEYGTTVAASSAAYTGTNTNGTSESPNNCANWNSGGTNVWVRGGNPTVTNGDWTFWVFAGCDGSWASGWKLYCFEQ